MQIIRRGEGRSAVAAAAYRSGARLVSEQSGRVADYRSRRGVVHTEILAPPGSAQWLQDRALLWNGVEKLEKRCDAQLAREINLALPAELSEDARLALVRAFVLEQFVARGMVTDLALHAPVLEKGEDPRNHHAHVLLTLRQGTARGLNLVKTRAWNSRDELRRWRAAWAVAQNRALKQAQVLSRVDHRTLEDQRRGALARGDAPAAALLDRLPEIHMGPRTLHAMRSGRQSHQLPALPPALPFRQPRLLQAPLAAPWHPELRVARNLDHLRSNAERHARPLAHWQVRAAQARSMFHRRERGIRHTHALRVPLSAAFLRIHRRKQLRLAQLIRSFDRLVRGLMLFRELRLQRRLILLRRIRRGRPRVHGRARRRVRRC